MRSAIVFVLSLSAFVSVCFGQSNNVAVGQYHTCFVAAGQMRCWGGGWEGQLGSGSIANLGIAPNQMSLVGPIAFAPSLGKATSVSAGEWHTCAIMETGGVVCFGHGNNGALGIGSEASVGCGGTCLSTVNLNGIAFRDSFLVTVLSSGCFHNCALFAKGKIRWYFINIT